MDAPPLLRAELSHARSYDRGVPRLSHRDAERGLLVYGPGLEALQRVADAALAYLSEDELLQELLLRISEILDSDTAAILLIDEDLSDELADTDEISITIPLAGGKVDTSRFSMAGAADAQQDMLDNTGEGDQPGAETI